MSSARGDPKDVEVQDTGDSAWKAPYGSLSRAGLRGSMESMHVAGASLKTNVLKSREGLWTNVSSRGATGGSTRGGMSLHVASDNISVLSATFAKGEEPKTEEQGGDQGDNEDCSSTGVPGLDGCDMSGWELVALRRREADLRSTRRNAGADGSVSGAG